MIYQKNNKYIYIKLSKFIKINPYLVITNLEFSEIPASSKI